MNAPVPTKTLRIDVGWTVSLGPVVPSERYAAWLADPVVTRYLEHAAPQTLDQLAMYIEARKQDSWFFGIYVDKVDKGNGQGQGRDSGPVHVGNIKAGPVDWKHRHADVGIMVGERDYWGCGIGTAAIRLLVDHAFAQGMHVLTAGIIEGNRGSLLAFLRAGFQWWGQFPEYRRFEGEWKAEWFLARVGQTAFERERSRRIEV